VAASVLINLSDYVSVLVVEPRKPAWYQLRKHFGSEFFHSDGTLDREKLGLLVFSDSSQRKIIESVTHPEIHKCILWRLARCFLRGTAISKIIGFFICIKILLTMFYMFFWFCNVITK